MRYLAYAAKADLSSSPLRYFKRLCSRGAQMNLKDTVALVTGGGSGLGEATIREFAGAGARVAILDLPSSPGAKVAESLGDKAVFAPSRCGLRRPGEGRGRENRREVRRRSCAGELRGDRARDAYRHEGRTSFARPVHQSHPGQPRSGPSTRFDWPRRRCRRINRTPTASAVSSSIPRRSRRSTARSGRRRIPPRRAAWSG